MTSSSYPARAGAESKIGLLSFLLINLVLGGCSSGRDSTELTFPASGTVTYNGKPLETGTITFYPQTASQPASGIMSSGGKFVLTTSIQGDGAIPGDYKVVVRSFRSSGDVGTGKSAEESLVPTKYNDISTTPLSATVGARENQFDFSLND